jgi:hypothetical protein
MGERRTNRGVIRTDAQILDHDDDVQMLLAVAAGRVTVDATNRMHLRRLAREELLLAGFGTGTTATLLPRGQRVVEAARGEVPRPFAD